MKTKCQKEVEVLSKQESYVSLHYIYQSTLSSFSGHRVKSRDSTCCLSHFNTLKLPTQHVVIHHLTATFDAYFSTNEGFLWYEIKKFGGKFVCNYNIYYLCSREKWGMP